MIEGIHAAVSEYKQKWQALTRSAKDMAFFMELTPNSIGWKVANIAEFDKTVASLRDHCDEVVHVWMNGRWIAKMILREGGAGLPWNIGIIKIMQVRPGSTDTLGLDHVDFYSPKEFVQIESVLKNEAYKWSSEKNEASSPDLTWASIWFDNTEAKIKHYTVLDIYSSQLAGISARIKGE